MAVVKIRAAARKADYQDPGNDQRDGNDARSCQMLVQEQGCRKCYDDRRRAARDWIDKAEFAVPVGIDQQRGVNRVHDGRQSQVGPVRRGRKTDVENTNDANPQPACRYCAEPHKIRARTLEPAVPGGVRQCREQDQGEYG